MSVDFVDEADEEVERRLAEIRQDPQRLMRYDRNGDGEIDAEEWEAVRKVVEAEIRGEHERENQRTGRSHTVPGAVLGGSAGGAIEVLQGRFEVLEKIGQGSQGQAFVGRDGQSGELVLIKEMRMAQVAEWKAVELFERESHTLKELSHAAIPRFIDAFHVDADPQDSDAGMRFFLVQEFIAGEDLQALIDGGLTVDEVAARAFLREMLGILDYLHTRPKPVIHRDIKPANIIRRTDRRMALVDFGAVQSAQVESSVKTVVGTSGYMPMEQLMGRATPASDLYALGATAVHLLSRRHPADLPLVGMQLQFKEFINVSPHFSQVLEKLLAVHVEDRFQSAKEVLAFLDGPAHAPLANNIRFGSADASPEAMQSFFETLDSTRVQRARESQSLWGDAPADPSDHIALPEHVEPPLTMRGAWLPGDNEFVLHTPMADRASFVSELTPFIIFFVLGLAVTLFVFFMDGGGAVLIGILFMLISLGAALSSVWTYTMRSRLELTHGVLSLETRNWVKLVESRQVALRPGMSAQCYRRKAGSTNGQPTYSYYMRIIGGEKLLLVGRHAELDEQLYICQEVGRYFAAYDQMQAQSDVQSGSAAPSRRA